MPLIVFGSKFKISDNSNIKVSKLFESNSAGIILIANESILTTSGISPFLSEISYSITASLLVHFTNFMSLFE